MSYIPAVLCALAFIGLGLVILGICTGGNPMGRDE